MIVSADAYEKPNNGRITSARRYDDPSNGLGLLS
jgi:hypothetical protein